MWLSGSTFLLSIRPCFSFLHWNLKVIPQIYKIYQIIWQSYTAATLLQYEYTERTTWKQKTCFASSNKSLTRCNSFSVYYPDVCLQLNMFRAFSRPSSGAQWLQWQLLVLPSYRGDSRAIISLLFLRMKVVKNLSSVSDNISPLKVFF